MSILLTFVLTTVINAALAALIIHRSLIKERRLSALILAETMNSLRKEYIARNLASHGEENFEGVYHQMMDIQADLHSVLQNARQNQGMIEGLLGSLGLTCWDLPNLGLCSKEYMSKVMSEES